MLTLQKNHLLAEIEDEKDENMNDNVAPIFQNNKVKTTTESTKILISEKKPRTDVRKYFIYLLQMRNQIPLDLLQPFKNGCFCKTCEEYSNTVDAHWKTLPRKHDEYPSQFFSDHENSSKRLNSIKTKRKFLM